MTRPASDHVPLDPVDAAWLCMDSAHNPMVITTVLAFDGPLADDALRGTLERFLEEPRFRQRVVRDRRTLAGLAWQDDPRFAYEHHVRRVRLAPPGDDAALRAFVSEQISTPLARDRPLFRVAVVDGVRACGVGGTGTPEGSALVVQVHHAVGDGVALVRRLLDVSGAAAASRPPEVGLARPPRPRTLRGWLGTAVARGTTLARLLLLWPDAHTPLRGALGARKVAAFSRPFSLAAIKAAAHRSGGHVNDLLGAAVAGALHAYLPAPRGVRALVPVFLRGGRERAHNQFGLVYLPLPVGEPDRAARLRAVEAEMDAVKAAPDATVAFMVLGALGLASPTLERLGIRLFTRKASMLVTNVPGPATAVRVAGREVKSLVVWAPTSGSIGLGWSLLTYAGDLRLGVAADARRVPDPSALVAAFERELDLLCGAAGGGS
ncbi:MAG: DUF1298 domain-containing protein [Myxococcales bacterium]|nr:DUF1298 domain-containing protein [Myxococcales bacterium]